MKNKIIGTDVSLEVCKNEGYLMLEMDGKFTPDKYIRLFRHYPDYCIEESPYLAEKMILDGKFTLDQLIEIYQSKKASIDKFTGMEYSIKSKEYDYYSFLSLADSIDSYLGLSNF